MSVHGGDRIAEVLLRQEIPFLFTLCGGHISPILSGAKQRGIRVIDVRDEATAVFAADAWARLSGRPGVAAVTAGPGVTNTITAVKNAQLAQSPVVILGGAAPTVLKGRGALQDIDQVALVKPHVKQVTAVRRVRDLVPAMQRALVRAMEGVPGLGFVECPIDLLYGEDLIREWYGAAGGGKSLGAKALNWYLQRHLARMFKDAGETAVDTAGWPAVDDPPAATLNRAAGALAKAQRPLLVIGSQALLQAGEAGAVAAAVAEMGIPVYLSGMARGLLGPDHPLHMRHQRRKALKEADCVLLAGVPCDFHGDYPFAVEYIAAPYGKEWFPHTGLSPRSLFYGSPISQRLERTINYPLFLVHWSLSKAFSRQRLYRLAKRAYRALNRSTRGGRSR